jgi:hypothetical protein
MISSILPTTASISLSLSACERMSPASIIAEGHELVNSGDDADNYYNS